MCVRVFIGRKPEIVYIQAFRRILGVDATGHDKHSVPSTYHW